MFNQSRAVTPPRATPRLWKTLTVASGAPWRGLTLALWALSRLVFVLNIALLYHPCDAVFWLYGHRMMVLHLLPYRDFAVEYPPLATLLFALPGAAPTYATYALGFAAVMVLIDGATLAGVIAATTRLGRPEAAWRAGAAYTVGSLLTSAVLCKFDLLPSVLTLVAVVLLATEQGTVCEMRAALLRLHAPNAAGRTAPWRAALRWSSPF